jgi:hypothetical protein
LDVPVFPDTPERNPLVEQTFAGFRTDRTPSGQLLWAPRIGFNYAAPTATAFQVRGGTGIFTGRVPFVWMSNQFINTGTILGTVDQRNPTAFVADPLNQRNAGAAVRTAEVNVVSENFKIPQVWRSNLAVDYTLPGAIIATVEGIYSKTINDVVYRDLNLSAPVGTLPGPDNRPVYNANQNQRRINPAFTNAILLDNTNEGYRYSVTGQLQKNFLNGLNTSVAYTYGKSMDVNSGTSSTALSNYEFNQIVQNPNQPTLSFSRFDIRHRVIATTGYTFRYTNNFATGISLFYQGQSGLPFTYLYQGDLNLDGNFGNDLLFVPASREQINLINLTTGGTLITPDQQWAALDNFISNDPYLNSRRGQYAERHGARMPWTHQVDLRLFQDIYVNAGNTRNTLQVTFDVFNVGNLINQSWGRQFFVNNSANEIITFAGRTTANVPQYQFNPNNRAYNISQFDSRWQGQLGLRYIFN